MIKELTLETFREQLLQQPHSYLVAMIIEGAQASTIVMSEKNLELYEVYFMIHEGIHNQGGKVVVTNVTKLS